MNFCYHTNLFLDNTSLLICNLSMLIGLLLLWEAFLLIQSSPKIKAFCSILYHVKQKRQKVFYAYFLAIL